MSHSGMVTAGIGLIVLAVTPTPDDVTVVSPLVQLGLGATLLTIGLMVKGDKK